MTQLPFSSACERNKIPILEVLQEVFPTQGKILEIGSCSGQHLVFFADYFPGLTWQASDRAEYLGGLAARLKLEGSKNTLEPIELDVLGHWPERVYDAVYSANTAHIMGWDAVCGMFAGLEFHLAPGGPFCLYGPFNMGGRFTANSNEEFDHELRTRSPEMGLRDLEGLESLAQRHQMTLVKKFAMPANNHVLVFRRNEETVNE